jgi:signal transduction histidine kinase
MPLFRRVRPSPWRNVLYTLIWNTLVALFLAAGNKMFSPNSHTFFHYLLPNLIVANMVGLLIHGALVVSDLLLGGWLTHRRGRARLLYYMVLVAACVIGGVAVTSALLRGEPLLIYFTRSDALMSLLPFAAFVALFMLIVLVTGERRAATETLAAQQREEIASAARLLAEARLSALQAQIEPHFLYNTLANVLSLVDTQPAQAKHMLERFIDYLRASLDASRAEQATVGAEVELARAYLDVLGVRMGARLSYSVETGDDVQGLPIAPMLLQPVVENALKHGLEPKVEGGHIAVRALRQGRQLCLEVSDNGAGLTETPPRPGGGVGLSNLRSRLRSLYDGAAQVQLIENPAGGITVRMLLPLEGMRPSTLPAP